MNWLAEHTVSSLNWLPYSPDLNPIEHLWDEIDRRIPILKEITSKISKKPSIQLGKGLRGMFARKL